MYGYWRSPYILEHEAGMEVTEQGTSGRMLAVERSWKQGLPLNQSLVYSLDLRLN